MKGRPGCPRTRWMDGAEVRNGASEGFQYSTVQYSAVQLVWIQYDTMVGLDSVHTVSWLGLAWLGLDRTQ